MIRFVGCKMNHEYFMGLALDEARNALALEEFPVGCVLVHQNRIIATGSRRGTADGGKNEIDHGEMVALRRFYDLNAEIDPGEITLYSTLEPCLMCFGAIMLSGIGEIVWAYEDAMGGATGCDRSAMAQLYSRNSICITPYVLREKSLYLFQLFFSRPENTYWKGSSLEKYTLAQAETSESPETFVGCRDTKR
jgi:tRNA(adenine34) deaminase